MTIANYYKKLNEAQIGENFFENCLKPNYPSSERAYRGLDFARRLDKYCDPANSSLPHPTQEILKNHIYNTFPKPAELTPPELKKKTEQLESLKGVKDVTKLLYFFLAFAGLMMTSGLGPAAPLIAGFALCIFVFINFLRMHHAPISDIAESAQDFTKSILFVVAAIPFMGWGCYATIHLVNMIVFLVLSESVALYSLYNSGKLYYDVHQEQQKYPYIRTDRKYFDECQDQHVFNSASSQ